MIKEINEFYYTFLFSTLSTLLFIIYLKFDKEIYNNYFSNNNNNYKHHYKNKKKKRKLKIGLLTNEIPPVVYGGVATWILNFMKMFKNDENYEVIPIFLAYNELFNENWEDTNNIIINKYPQIRVITNEKELINSFNDIDVCVNNLWVSLESIKLIVDYYPNLKMISVCHSLIKMEHITNLGSIYTNDFFKQEITFQYSDYVVLISKAEKIYYESFGYSKYKAQPVVIYNSYSPKFDDKNVFNNYTNDNLGYIGRHVPRKRPELAILGIDKLGRKDVEVFNMGVDFDKYDNSYWRKLDKQFKQLNIIPFSTDKSLKEKYYKSIGVNIISGIYEPFGYTLCECLDRRIPVIVQNIDGPIEIVNKVKNNVYIYEVDKKSLKNDVDNLVKTLSNFYKTDPDTRKKNSEIARLALDQFRPENIKVDWLKLFNNDINNNSYNWFWTYFTN